jgi:hypothetical protein
VSLVVRCKSDRCAASIVWCETVNGKRMPLDEASSPEGKWRMEDEGCKVPTALYVPADERKNRDDLHESHWGSCVDADTFRKKATA